MTISRVAASERATSPSQTIARHAPSLRKWLGPSIGLLAILVAYCAVVLHLHPANFFGLTEDDTIYFTSAREIARGHGYVLPNIPGEPAATKYPIFYPWLLSWIWRWNPSFPANVSSAVYLNLFFGCAFAVAAFVYLRRVSRFGMLASLLLTLFCALTSNGIFSSLLVMSDIPFAALALSACVAASLPASKDGTGRNLVAAGILAGLAALTRTLGVPIALGLCAGICLRTGWRKAAAFGAAFLPFAAYLAWRAITVIPNAVPTAGTSSCPHSWHMTWLYYTDYIGYWKADTLANHTLLPVIKANALLMLLQPGGYILSSAGAVNSFVVSTALLTIASAVVIRGMARQLQTNGLSPVHFALVLYVLPLLVWDYNDHGRFLLPFLPLFASGLWIEVQHLIGMIKTSLQAPKKKGDRAAAGLFALVGVALVVVAGASWRHKRQQFADFSDSRADMLSEKKQAYDWLKGNTPSDARILAYEEGLAYLYSNRLAVRPIIFSPAGTVRADILDTELSCIGSNGPEIRARYWLISDDDFGFEWEPAQSRASIREKEVEKALSQVFRSQNGHVRIYELDGGNVATRSEPEPTA
jgi:hypothetical protein